jgi:hypothetical protein
MADRGRRPGSMNAKTLELRERLENMLDGKSLPEVLVGYALDLRGAGEIKDAADVLDKAARYTYPTLKAIEHSGEIKTEMPVAPEPGPAPTT